MSRSYSHVHARTGNSKVKLINLPAMYQKQRNNASVSTRGKKNVLNYFWNWKQVTLNGKLLIMRADLSVKLHAAFTIRVNEENTRWSSNSPVTPHIKRLAMWTCMATATDDVIWYPTTVKTLSPWLIQKKESCALPCCFQPPPTKKKKVVSELHDLDRSDCSGEMLSALLCARGLSTECRERAARTYRTNRHPGEGLCNNYRFPSNWKTNGGDANRSVFYVF